MTRRAIGRLLAVAAAVLLLVLLRFTLLRPAAVPVAVARVARGHVEETVSNSRAGTVKSRRRATLSTEVGGRVAELPVKKGQPVKAGQLLMRLADGDLRAQLRLQESSLVAARASERESCRALEQAELDLARSQSLLAKKIVSQEILDKARTSRDMAFAACDAARARIAQAAASVDVARVVLEKTALRAPFDGVVADITTEVGEWITPSPPGLPIPPVLEVLDMRSIYISAPLDEVDVGKVKVEMPVRITMDAFPGKTIGGRVTRVAPYVLDIKEQNRTFEVEVDFDDASFARTLKPGLSADVAVILTSKDGVLRIPAYALLEGSRAMVVREGRLATVPVKSGLKNWDFVEVVEGLKEGDRVVVSLDRPEVKEGARAAVEEEAGAGSGK